ncbi:MAG: hypothetical protein ABJB98_05145 [Actinomycetota bacterium]
MARVVAVLVGLTLILAGTLWGTDDDFPFGPFRMYSTRGDPDGVVRELRVRVVLSSGRVLDVTDTAGAPRRAELEGRLAELIRSPAALAGLVPLYTKHLPDRARSLELGWLSHPLHGGRSGPASYAVIRATAVPP